MESRPDRSGCTVVAIGGNSLIRSGEKGRGNLDTHEVAREVCEEIAVLAETRGSVVVTHGNGPQVGFELLRNAAAADVVPPDGMDVNVAATQGYIGYYLQQVLGDVLEERGRDIPVASLVTQVTVDPGDPGFDSPSKPVGPFYTREEAARMSEEDGWQMSEDAGRGWRRVVPSPRPVKILELPCIEALVDAGQIVICTGGGGVPVVRDGLKVRGVAAVIDKDRASSLLATRLGADTFVISTAVPRVCLNYGTPEEKPLERIGLEELSGYVEEGHFAPGSMRPKIEAARRFLEEGGSRVIITSPGNILAAMEGRAGTTIKGTGAF
jgi:carbamate kinase